MNMDGLELVYNAPTKQAAEAALEEFADKWEAKYGYAILSWRNNWENLTQYFDFPIEIRKIIYTTNVIESLNNGIRKYTRSKCIFPDDQSAMKAVYLAIQNVERKWGKPISNWGLILNQFMTIFDKRCRI